jgi:hypothetical protein
MLFDETQLLLRFKRHSDLLSGLHPDPLCFEMTKRERSVYFERAFLHLQDAFFLALDQRAPSDAFFRTLLLEHTAFFLKLRGPNDETAFQRSLLHNDHLLQVISAALFFVADRVPLSYFEHRDRFGANYTQYLFSAHPNLDWRLLSPSITRVLHACLPSPSDSSTHSSWRDALFALHSDPSVAQSFSFSHGALRPPTLVYRTHKSRSPFLDGELKSILPLLFPLYPLEKSSDWHNLSHYSERMLRILSYRLESPFPLFLDSPTPLPSLPDDLSLADTSRLFLVLLADWMTRSSRDVVHPSLADLTSHFDGRLGPLVLSTLSSDYTFWMHSRASSGRRGALTSFPAVHP